MPCTFRGGNVPFRRLCASFGAEATMSEMSYARNLVKGNVVERTHLRQAANEDCFGEQHWFMNKVPTTHIRRSMVSY